MGVPDCGSVLWVKFGKLYFGLWLWRRLCTPNVRWTCDFGQIHNLWYIRSQRWAEMVQFDTQLLFREYKGRSLWLSLEKRVFPSQLHVCGCATSGPLHAIMANGGGRKNPTHRGASLTTQYNNYYSLGSCCSFYAKGFVFEPGSEEEGLQQGKDWRPSK